MTERQPPFFPLTDDDHGGIAVVAALSMIVISLSIASIRQVVAVRQSVQFQYDDAIFYLATVFAVVSSICIYRAVLAGLGRHIENVDPQSLNAYYKLMYTAQILSILSMTSAKVSVVMLFKRIATTANRSFKFGLLMCAMWGVFSFFAVLFQCQLPKPWVFVPSQCSTHGYLQIPVIGLNMVTDAILAMGILPTIWKLKMPQDTKVTVMALFGIRLAVSGLALGELVSVAKSVRNPDQTWVSLARAIWLMSVNHLSVITATIPRTHSFWASLQTGKSGITITEQEYELSSSIKNSAYSSRANNSGNQNSKTSRNSSNLHSLNWSKSRDDDVGRSGSKIRFRPTQESSRDNQLEHRNSQEPLRLTPKQNSELKTRIYSEGPAGETMMGGKEDDDTSQCSLRNTSTADLGVWREREVIVEVEYNGRREGRDR